MKKACLFLLMVFGCCAGIFAQQDTLKYRILLSDKNATTYSLSKPDEFLSAKAIERRLKQHLAVDSTDIPVCQTYVNGILSTGVKLVAKGKWENFVTVSCNDTTVIETISRLPYVRSVQCVWKVRSADLSVKTAQRDSLINSPKWYVDSLYGPAVTQIKLSRADKLHEAGFKGQTMTIGVIDAGFHNLDRIQLLDNVRILGFKDFVNPSGDIFGESSHGLGVLSCIAANKPNVLVGTAPEAAVWLFRSEDSGTEFPVEQDYWAEAAEYADSVGVDVINSSLGYYEFDDPSMNYELHQVDGNSSLISRQASRLAGKGIILVCSAGNSGMGAWKKITPPADAFDVLTVGAVDKNGRLAPFSSVGTTADGRIKPDVMAVGMNSNIVQPNGNQGLGSGTSFASPIMCGMVACLWQACPRYTAVQLMDLLRRSSDRAQHPDNIYGYGIPDVWKAYQMYLDETKPES